MDYLIGNNTPTARTLDLPNLESDNIASSVSADRRSVSAVSRDRADGEESVSYSVDTEDSFSESNFVFYYLARRELQLSKTRSLLELQAQNKKAYQARIVSQKRAITALHKQRRLQIDRLKCRLDMLLLIVQEVGLTACLANAHPFERNESDEETVYCGLRYSQCIVHTVLALGGVGSVLNKLCAGYLFQRRDNKAGSVFSSLSSGPGLADVSQFVLLGEYAKSSDDLVAIAICSILRSFAEYHRAMNVLWILSEISIKSEMADITAYYQLYSRIWTDCWKVQNKSSNLSNCSNELETNSVLVLVKVLLSGAPWLLAKDIHEWGIILEDVANPTRSPQLTVRDSNGAAKTLHEALSMPCITAWILCTYYGLAAKVLHELPETFKYNNCLSLFHVVQEWLLRITSVRLNSTYIYLKSDKELAEAMHNERGLSACVYPCGERDSCTLLKFVTARLCPNVFRIWTVSV